MQERDSCRVSGILARAKDIGKHNTLISSYALGAWLIAMNRQDGLSPEKNYELLAEGLRNSRLFCMMLGGRRSLP